MEPKIWGPHFWFVLHIISFHYPEHPSTYEKDAIKNFYHSVKDILPCAACRQHYTNYLSRYPIEPHLDTRMDLIRWVIQVHNFVNVSLGKPAYSVDTVLAVYANLDPVSPFIKVNVEEINSKKQQALTGRLWVFIIILAALIIGLKWLHSTTYYYLA
jgi:hypothetical protein